ncbi:MAG: HAD-IA family hydrolase [Candidatus Paceibacterota bacterium]|jgi:HAD superfamily hydrolase (TIGR01509 family)
MIKVIFFDLGDVLINNSFEQVLAEVARNLNIGYGDVNQINCEFKGKLMIGEMSVREVSSIIKDRLSLSLTVEEIYEAWEKSYEAVRIKNEELYSIVYKLKKKYVVGMISNIYDLMAKIDRERGILDDFNPCILSCDVGLQKPTKEIFELALKQTNLNANECIFIDNRLEHLISPTELGFHTILFEGNEKTIEALKELGCL